VSVDEPIGRKTNNNEYNSETLKTNFYFKMKLN
jgi:hypothetical protein